MFGLDYSKTVNAYMTNGVVMRVANKERVDVDRLIFERDLKLWVEHVSWCLRNIVTESSPHFSPKAKGQVNTLLCNIAKQHAAQALYRPTYTGGVALSLWETFADSVIDVDAKFNTDYFDALFEQKMRSVPRIKSPL